MRGEDLSACRNPCHTAIPRTSESRRDKWECTSPQAVSFNGYDGKELLSANYDAALAIIGFINMTKCNLLECISEKDNHLQLPSGTKNKCVCMQIRSTFYPHLCQFMRDPLIYGAVCE